MIKRLILAVNNNKVLTLCAIALAVVIELFGSTNGIWAAGALVALEVLRRRYNQLDWWYQSKKWLLLIGMSFCASGLIGGLLSCLMDAKSAGGIALVLLAVLTTVATTYHLSKIAVDRWHEYDVFIQILWVDLLGGIIGSMVTGTYALTCYLLGSTLAEIIQDKVVWYAGGLSLILIALFVVIMVGMVLAYMWDKLVDWARR